MDIRRNVVTRFIGQDRTGGAARSAARNVNTLGGAYDSLNRRVAITNRLVAGATLGVGGASVIRTASNLQLAEARLSAVTKTLASDQVFLANTSRKLSLDLESAYTSFAKLKVLEESGALRQGEARETLEGLAQAYARFGASAGQQENVIYGVAQAFGQGTLQAQELNQVVEPLPGLLNAIAREAGTTAAGYRALAKQGKITSVIFKRDLLNALKKFDGTAEALAGNIQQTLTRVSNSYKQTLQDLNEPLTTGIQNFGEVSNVILSVAGNNIGALTGLFALLAVRQAAAFGNPALSRLNNFGKELATVSKQTRTVVGAEVKAYQVRGAAEKKFRADANAARIQERRDLARTNAAQAANARIAAQGLAAAKTEDALKSELAAAGKRAALDDATNKSILAKQTASLQRTEVQRLQALQRIQTVEANSAKGIKTKNTAARRLELTTQKLIKAQKQLTPLIAAEEKARKAVLVPERQLNKAYADANKLSAEQAQLRQNSVVLANAETRARQETAKQTDKLNRANKIAATRTLAYSAALKANTLGMRAATAASVALASGAKLVSGAYSLIGGPTGVFLVAAYGAYKLYERVTQVNPAVAAHRDLVKQATEELEAYSLSQRAAINGLTEAEQSYSDSVVRLKNQRDALVESGEEVKRFGDGWKEQASRILSNIALIAGGVGGVRQATAINLQSDIDKLQRENAKLVELQRSLSFLEQRASLAAANTPIDRVTPGVEVADKLLAPSAAVTKLTSQIKTLDVSIAAAIKAGDGQADNLIKLNAARTEAVKLLEKANGTTERQKKAQSELTRIIKDQTSALTAGLTERERIRAETQKQLDAISTAQSRVSPGDTGYLNDAQIIDARARLNKAADAEIQALDVAAAERKTELAAEVVDNQISLWAKELEERKRVTQQLNEANRQVDPVRFAEQEGRNKLTNLKTDNIAGRIKSETDYQTLKKSIELETQRNIEAAKDQIIREANARRAEQFKVDEVAKLAGITKNFLSVARKEVGSYIEITESMTAAERRAAEESNKANEKAFKRNKKVRKASAIIDALAGANRAFAQQGAFGFATAASILAAGFANVRAIQSESFASTAASNVGNVQSRTGTNTSTGGSDRGTTTNIFYIGDGVSQAEAQQKIQGILPELDAAVKANNLKVDLGDGKIQVSDAKFLRHRRTA